MEVKMQTERWTTATLAIQSEVLCAEDISERLGISPSRSFLKGELMSKRNPNSKVREENLWLLDSSLGDQVTIESHIEYFLSIFKEKAGAIESLYQDCIFVIRCAYSAICGQGGFTLDHEQLGEFVAYPIHLSVNLYPPGEQE